MEEFTDEIPLPDQLEDRLAWRSSSPPWKSTSSSLSRRLLEALELLEEVLDSDAGSDCLSPRGPYDWMGGKRLEEDRWGDFEEDMFVSSVLFSGRFEENGGEQGMVTRIQQGLPSLFLRSVTTSVMSPILQPPFTRIAPNKRKNTRRNPGFASSVV